MKIIISRTLTALGLLIFTVVGIFSLCYLSKRGIDAWLKPFDVRDYSTPVIWNGTVDWYYDIQPRPRESELPKTFVLVRTLEEAVAQPIGTWIMDAEGRIGKVAKSAERIDPWGNVVKWMPGIQPFSTSEAAVFVKNIEEAVSLPVGTWILNADGHCGQVKWHAERPVKRQPL